MKKLLLLLVVVLIALQGQAQKGKDEALEALGGSCGLLLYNTFIIVGITADAYSAGTYDADKANQIIGEQLGGVETVEQQYNALVASGFLTDPSDVKFIKETVKAFDLVRAEANALLAYIQSGSDEDGAEYDSYRQKAWTEISRLLGFED